MGRKSVTHNCAFDNNLLALFFSTFDGKKLFHTSKIAFMKKAKPPESEQPVPYKAIFEQERKVLLELGNDITRVRDKNDLIILFSKRIKGLFYFTHTLVALIDYKDETYSPFLLDNKSPFNRIRITRNWYNPVFR